MKKLITKLTIAFAALIGLFGLVSVSAKADQVKIGANAKNVKVKTFKYSESQSTTDSDKKDSDSDKKDSDDSEDTDSLTGDAKLDSDVETFILKQSKNGYELDNIIVKQNNDIMVVMHKAK
jgi:hypothetical protein